MTKDDILIQQLREINYPGQVDVTDRVMQQIAQRPLLVPAPAHRWKRISIVAAACAALFVAVNFALIYTRDYNVSQIGSCLAEVYDYHADYGSGETDYYTLGGIESLYE